MSLPYVIVEEKSSDLITYNNQMAETIYYNTLPALRKDTWKSIKDEQLIVYNKYGFRSPEFIQNPDYLFSGCSVTFGNGLDKDSLWHERLISDLGGTYASVAMHGDSIPGQVLKIFAYIKQFGAPKNIVALFPDFDRFLVYNNKKLFASRTFFNFYDKQAEEWAMSGSSDDRAREYMYSIAKNTAPVDPNQSDKDFFKRPLIADEVITEEMSHMYASQYIHMLSEYCNIAGINLVWSTWDHHSEKIILKIKNDLFFNEYVSSNATQWHFDNSTMIDDFNGKDCHSDLKDHPLFNLANDRSLGVEFAHFGVHRQTHYYETFLKYIKENWL